MKTVWKYPVPPQEFDHFALEMPRGARFLHVETQRDEACLWALVDPDREKVEWRFRVFGTGHPIPEPERFEYVGTFFLFEGAFVGHVFLELFAEAAGAEVERALAGAAA